MSIWINPEKNHMGPTPHRERATGPVQAEIDCIHYTDIVCWNVLVRYFLEKSYIRVSRLEAIPRAPPPLTDLFVSIHCHPRHDTSILTFLHLRCHSQTRSSHFHASPPPPLPPSCQQLDREPDAPQSWSGSPRRSNCVQIARLCANLRLFPVAAAATGGHLGSTAGLDLLWGGTNH